MRKLIVNTFLTLDGVMQAPGGPEEDDDGGFTQGGWSVTYWDDQMGRGHGRGDEQAVRHGSGTQDLRHHGRVLADRPRGDRRQGLQRRDEVCCLAEPPGPGAGATRS